MSTTSLSAELEAALMRELARSYDSISWSRFGSKLVRPVIGLSDATRRLGQWQRGPRRLELQRELVLERPWPEVLDVLAHEMAHQYVDEVLQIRDESAHGETFRRVCEERGIDARRAGSPAGVAGDAENRTLERIRKLFALAGSSNQHEAEAAMKRAHELMLRHNLDELPSRPEFEVRHLGAPHRRADPVEAQILALLTELFFVEVISIPVYEPSTGKRGRTYEVSGTRPNLEMAEHVHAFLLATAARLWRENRGDARVRSGRDRVAYQTGVIQGFRDKLVAERRDLRGKGLVWRGDARLAEFYRRRNPRIVTRQRRVRANRAHDAGREAGHDVILHKPVATSTGNAGRLLR